MSGLSDIWRVTLMKAYCEMALDENREREAESWCEGVIENWVDADK